MIDKLKKIGYFLCLIQNNQLNLADVAFMIILGKIIVAQNVDWAALCAFAATVLNSMHQRQRVNSSDISDMTAKLQGLEDTVTKLKSTI